jgi:hypothetical protein
LPPVFPSTDPKRLAFAPFALGSLLLLSAEARSAEVPVRVTIQDQPRFEHPSTTLRDDTSYEIGADLLDDSGAPIEAALVSVALSPARPFSWGPCGAGSHVPARETALRTDATGRVCVRAFGVPADSRLSLRFAGDELHLPATASIAVQPTPSAPTLAFDAPSLELDLDQPTLRLRVGVNGASNADPLPPIELELSEEGRRIPLTATDWSRAGDTIAFVIDTHQLGTPGPARLVARMTGRERGVHAEAIALKVATVQLEAELAAPESGEAVDLRVSTRAHVGGTPSGWVEATGDAEQAIGSAPFERGSAVLHLGDATGPIRLHYRSDDPWWLPGQPLELVLPGGADTQHAPRRWPWLALLAPIGYVCMRALQRPALRKNERQPSRKARAPALVSEPASAPSGWVGKVSDAHDGLPIAGARVQVLLPSFVGSEANLLTAIADAQGAFQLPPLQDPLPEGARLRVWAPLHSEVERPLPPQGRVSLTLTSRRRAVLRRLVRWARALGAPWARGGEPTPGEIAEIAARRGDPRTARWAEDVQAAAFGHTEVDEAREASLRAAEPAWHLGATDAERGDD